MEAEAEFSQRKPSGVFSKIKNSIFKQEKAEEPAKGKSSNRNSLHYESETRSTRSMSITPKVKQVQTKARGKSNRYLKHLFIAQQLHTNPNNQNNNPIRAIEFSPHGKYLAVASKDGIINIWQVLSTPDTRETATNQVTRPTTPTSFTTSQSQIILSSGPILPVFSSKPIVTLSGHTSEILTLSWSKNNFLLSSSTDKSVRLWLPIRDGVPGSGSGTTESNAAATCLCVFEHVEMVTGAVFHPKDDRFFISGSIDCRLRLWNIVEKKVQIWTELPELITCVSFTSDGKYAIAGTLSGSCMFFDVNTFQFHSQILTKSFTTRTSKGAKVSNIYSLDLTGKINLQRTATNVNNVAQMVDSLVINGNVKPSDSEEVPEINMIPPSPDARQDNIPTILEPTSDGDSVENGAKSGTTATVESSTESPAQTTSSLSTNAANVVHTSHFLVSTNDSKIRLFSTTPIDPNAPALAIPMFNPTSHTLIHKFSGHTNVESQIRASFSNDARFIISASEDKGVYVWESGLPDETIGDMIGSVLKKKHVPAYEHFQLPSNHNISCALFAPRKTLDALRQAKDPIFEEDDEEELAADAPKEELLKRDLENAIVLVADSTGVIYVLRNTDMKKHGWKL